MSSSTPIKMFATCMIKTPQAGVPIMPENMFNTIAIETNPYHTESREMLIEFSEAVFQQLIAGYPGEIVDLDRSFSGALINTTLTPECLQEIIAFYTIAGFESSSGYQMNVIPEPRPCAYITEYTQVLHYNCRPAENLICLADEINREHGLDG